MRWTYCIAYEKAWTHKISIKTITYDGFFSACHGHLTRYICVAALTIMAGIGHPGASAGADFTFAALGDAPYTEEDEPRFVSMIAEINREPLAFSIHVGDFKNGWSPCTDTLFLQRRDWFALFRQPLMFTPGDNEWTDCHRAPGAAHDPLERLQKLRSLFFFDSDSLGQQKIALIRQSTAYPENARWEREGIVFATLNVPGSADNKRMPAERAARGKANADWISRTFEAARAQSSPAVVLVMQANPFNGNTRDGPYARLLDVLTLEAVNFNGEVLLIHGDTHRYRMDQPLADPRGRSALRNFTRLEVFGHPFTNWVRVRVSQHAGKVTFTPSPGN